jgi:hypothetical protein
LILIGNIAGTGTKKHVLVPNGKTGTVLSSSRIGSSWYREQKLIVQVPQPVNHLIHHNYVR